MYTETGRPQRTTYLRTMPRRSPPQSPRSAYDTSSRSACITPSPSGHPTPKETREEKWREEAEATLKPTKIEMREMYKELRGRKARDKGKLGGTSGMRDRGGWGEPIMDVEL